MELEAEQGLSVADIDVLIQLAAAEGGTLRMSDLADRVVISRSGMTRRVDRLEEAGLVRRASCSEDRRGAYAIITPEGRTRLEDALPVHLRGIEQHFVSRLTADDLTCLRDSLGKLTSGPVPDAQASAEDSQDPTSG